jgi:hypothetical protein
MRFKELGRDVDEETIKTAYRRLAKFYNPDGWFIHLSVLPTVFEALFDFACVSRHTIRTLL